MLLNILELFDKNQDENMHPTPKPKRHIKGTVNNEFHGLVISFFLIKTRNNGKFYW